MSNIINLCEFASWIAVTKQFCKRKCGILALSSIHCLFLCSNYSTELSMK